MPVHDPSAPKSFDTPPPTQADQKEKDLYDRVASRATMGKPVIMFGNSSARQQVPTAGMLIPTGLPTIIDIRGALCADTLNSLHRSLKHVESAHQGNDATVAELRRLVRPPLEAAHAEQTARRIATYHTEWLEYLDSFPGVKSLRRLAEASGLTWGVAAVVSLRAQLCVAHGEEEAWADALPVQEAAALAQSRATQCRKFKTTQYALMRQVNYWSVRFGCEEASYLDNKGTSFGYLTKLLAHPGRNLDVNILLGQLSSQPIPDRSTKAKEENTSDDQAIAEEEAILRSLVEEIKEAEAANDTYAASELRQQFNAITEHVQSEKGTHGHRKKLGPKSPAEKAHHAIATAVRRLCERLKRKMPKLAAHLKAALKMDMPDFGYFPPADAPPWQITT